MPSSTTRRLPRFAAAVAALVLGSSGLAAVPAVARPPGAATGTADAAAATRFRLDLARPGDFVAQANFVQCVGASMQMMLNIIRPERRPDRRDPAPAPEPRPQPVRSDAAGFERKGASVRGWSAGLNQLGAGPYRLVGATTLDEAMRLAADVDPDDRQARRAARLGRPPRLGDERLRGDRGSAPARRASR